MDWSEFRNLVNEHLPTIVAWLVAILIALMALIFTLIKTRTKAIQKKAKELYGLDFDNYVIEVNGVEYNLNDVVIRKRGKIHASKNEKQG